MRAMRPIVAACGAVLGSVVSAAWIVGCSLLVTFDELPADDSGIALPTARPPDVSVVDGGADASAPADGGPATDAAVDYSAVCTGKADGKYCNGNQIGVDGGSSDDLITCLNGKTANVKPCATGNGCVRMPSGFPDECDQCQGKANGLYCGDDFTGWHPMNAKTRIRCDNDAIVGNLICQNACVGTGPGASCQ